jgi:predicted GIY-YIG superfamily endonuclease
MVMKRVAHGEPDKPRRFIRSAFPIDKRKGPRHLARNEKYETREQALRKEQELKS